MGMWNNAPATRSAAFRALLLPLGLFSVLWSLTAVPSFWRTAPARDIIARIIADDRFRPGVLDQMLVRIEAEPVLAIPRPELSLASVLVRLRIAEEGMQRRTLAEADREVEAAEHQLMASLKVTPSDSFLWLMLYSVKTTRNGFDPEIVRYLERSYLAGPHEGWIAVRRNRLALSIFPTLRDGTRQLAVSEFAELVDGDFIQEAAANLIGVGWAQNERLLSALGGIDLSSKTNLWKRLRAEGINVKIPGLEFSERPWR
ncbi:hypothetical protein IVA89_26605 [Bradyrhizobium sp. 150]|nr:hypothetical protein [Bradyrhizobium sp. 150]